MAEETRTAELNDNKNQSNQAIVHRDTEVDLTPNHNSGSDGDETRGRCHSCCLCCSACCKLCMTKHNPLPDSPTRFDILLLLLLSFSVLFN